jgi:hypothetical protein
MGTLPDLNMVIERADRRAGRRTKVAVLFADRTDRALDLIELLDMAWHDQHQEPSPPESLIDDILLLSGGDLWQLIRWTRVAATDWREARDAAEELRESA